MASDPSPPHGDPVDPSGSTGMATILPPVTAESAETIAASAEALLAAPLAPEAPAGAPAAVDVAAEAVLHTTSTVADATAEAVDRQDQALAEAAASLEAMRQQAQHYAQQNVEAVRGQIARGQEAAARATTSFDDSYRLASEALMELNQKMADSMRANIESTVAFWTSMMGTRSLSEAVALNAQHIRKQMEALTAQSRELTSIAQRLATQSFEPLRNSFHSDADQK
jgi:phasin family protein